MSAAVALEFEKPVKNLEAKIAELSRLVGEETDGAMSVELEKLREQAAKRVTQVYSNLDPWQKCQVARHPDRPSFLRSPTCCCRIISPWRGIVTSATIKRFLVDWRGSGVVRS